MDPQVKKLIDGITPKFNPRIAGGFVMDEVKHAPHYVNNLIESIKQDFPEGLVYLGMTRVTPEEEYQISLYDKVFDISKSTIFAVKLMFEYKGEPLKPQYFFLPYLEEGAMLTIGSVPFNVTPVLIDRAYSVSSDNIFLYINRSKLVFRQFTHNYYEGSDRVSAFVVASELYHGRNNADLPANQLRATHKMKLILIHYLIAKFGVYEFFMRYFGFEVFIGGDEQINHEKYPASEWTICSSLGIKPTVLKTTNYRPSNIKLAVRTENLDSVTRGIIAGIFYIIDFYPERVKAEYANDAKLWYLLLALTIKPDVPQEQVALVKLDGHFKSLDTFVDKQVKELLAEEGVFVEDIFDVLTDMLKTYSHRINVSIDDLATMYNKRLVILRYLLAEVRNRISYLGFDLQSLVNGNKPYGKAEIESIMTKCIKRFAITDVKQNAEVNSVSNSTDNIVPNLTLPVKSQASMAVSAKGNLGGKKKVVTFRPDMVLSASIAEVGNLTSDAKDDFTGRSRINPYLQVGIDGSVERNPDLRDVIDRTQADIKRY